MAYKLGGVVVIDNKIYCWHRWDIQQFKLNEPLFKNPSYTCPDFVLRDILDERLSAELWPMPEISTS